MSTPPPVPGSVGWFDLTAPDAEGLREFYEAVVGWTTEPVDMGDYVDHVVQDAHGNPVGGVCHAKGSNAELPPVWLPYVIVIDIDASCQEARERGGHVLGDIRDMGSHGRMAVVRDPAGACLALMQPPA